MIRLEPTPLLPEVKAALDRGTDVYLELVKHTPGTATEERLLLLGAYRSLALDHFRSILVLCQAGDCTGSAFALFRPLVETVVRGEWLCFCASVAQCEAFMRRKFDRGCVSFRTMTREIDQAVGLGARLVPFEQVYLDMSDFTHTGYDAVVPRLSDNGKPGQCYCPEQTVLLLTQATKITALHVSLSLQMAGQKDDADAVLCKIADLAN